MKKLLMIISTAFLTFAFAMPATAQTKPRVFQPGEMVEVGGGEIYKIIRCDGSGEWDECDYQAYWNGKPNGDPGRMTIRNLRAAEQRVRDAKRRENKLPDGALNTNDNPSEQFPTNKEPERKSLPSPKNKQTTKNTMIDGADGQWKVGDRLEVNYRSVWYSAVIIAAQVGKYKVHYEGYPDSDDAWVDASRMRPVGGIKIAADCSFEPPGPAVTAQSRFSEALAQRKIYDEYNRKVNGTIQAPLRLGVVFLAFEMGISYKNTVTDLPGYGPQRRHAGAPVGTMIYTFKSKRLICEEYRDGVGRRLVEGTSACFIDKDGLWTCPSENDTKITQLDQ
ncbi:MAG TPA: agenet domain-containing protein [Pyrinomonadaceae bacterium]|jgi:hypothetical protein